MCEWNDTVIVNLCTPRKNYHTVSIDRCIAPLVQALNDAGIETIASCCGHGKLTGNIVLGDNRVLEIHPDFNIWIKEQHAKNKINIHGERRSMWTLETQ